MHPLYVAILILRLVQLVFYVKQKIVYRMKLIILQRWKYGNMIEMFFSDSCIFTIGREVEIVITKLRYTNNYSS